MIEKLKAGDKPAKPLRGNDVRNGKRRGRKREHVRKPRIICDKFGKCDCDSECVLGFRKPKRDE